MSTSDLQNDKIVIDDSITRHLAVTNKISRHTPIADLRPAKSLCLAQWTSICNFRGLMGVRGVFF